MGAVNAGGHLCKAPEDRETELFGDAADECYEDVRGRFWITNGEYANTVAYCPFCGTRAPNPVGHAMTPDKS